MKPQIQFRAIRPADYAEFTRATDYYPGPQFGGIVAFHDDVVMGAVGLDGWTKQAVMAHWWIRHPRCILPLWREVQHYLFSHGIRKVVGMTPASNLRALRMIFCRLDWREVARIKNGWDAGVDIIISEYNIHGHDEFIGSAGIRRDTSPATSGPAGTTTTRTGTVVHA